MEGRRIAFVGDGNNVAASLAYAAALSGVEVAVASPDGYELDAHVVDRARNLGGGVVIRTPNRVFDYTWKQQLVAARGKLAEILKRV